MRKLFVPLAVLFFITFLVAQEKKIEVIKEPKVTTETPYYKITIDPEEIKKAGESLRQFKNTTYLGYALIYGGSIVAYFGIINRNERTNEIEPDQTLLWTGGLTSLLGLIITITASHKVEEAGKHLQNAITTEP
ncbi:hypothetical protein ES703_120514 [subsurface metagenome]